MFDLKPFEQVEGKEPNIIHRFMFDLKPFEQVEGKEPNIIHRLR